MTDLDFTPPYWVVDILPEQVPAAHASRYFPVEAYFRDPARLAGIRTRFASLLLKLNCYRGFLVESSAGTGRVRDPAPERLAEALTGCAEDLTILIPDEGAAFTVDRDDTHMTLWHPTVTLLRLVGQLAQAEGLFLWQPPQEGGPA